MSNVTSGFIDLATYDELEKYMYGGDDATAYFVRETRKSTWFTQVPVALSRASGTPSFDSEFSFTVSRAGDYLLAAWLRLTTPAVTASQTVKDAGEYIRWTPNFMHNIIRECSITFNDLVAARFDQFHLDFWAAFTVPAGKRNGYENMIGNFGAMTNPTNKTIQSQTLNLPLPFFFCRDSGVALPTAALPYNDMRINFNFRPWTDLLIVSAINTGKIGNPNRSATSADIGSGTGLGTSNSLNAQVWANYAIVSNDERKRMGKGARDMLIEQVQTAPKGIFTPGGSPNYQVTTDIRFSHAIKVLFFSVRNKTTPNQWSNYTTADAAPSVTSAPLGTESRDPVLSTSLIYENTNRLAAMGSDYFSLMNPWYHAPTIPEDTGYHMFSYSLDFMDLDPKGSTNYGKLTNVSLVLYASTSASVSSNALDGAQDASGQNYTQSYETVVTCVNNNIVRVAGGALGFPVL